MSHHFEVKQSRNNEWVAYFKYNHETIFWSEGYRNQQSAINAIKSVMKNASGAEVRDLTDDAPFSIQDQIESTKWTGLGAKVGPQHLQSIQEKTESLLNAIIQSDTDYQTKLDACKRVEAVQLLLTAPNVPWRQVVELLNHPSTTAFLTALNIIQFILGLAQ